jgi:hypothetical protein
MLRVSHRNNSNASAFRLPCLKPACQHPPTLQPPPFDGNACVLGWSEALCRLSGPLRLRLYIVDNQIPPAFVSLDGDCARHVPGTAGLYAVKMGMPVCELHDPSPQPSPYPYPYRGPEIVTSMNCGLLFGPACSGSDGISRPDSAASGMPAAARA